METWLIVLIVAGLVAVAVVVVGGVTRARKRQGSTSSIGLPPMGAVSADGPPTNEAGPLAAPQSRGTGERSDHHRSL